MLRLFTLINPKVIVLAEDEALTVYVPLSSKEIPRDQLESILRGWFYPELAWVTVYSDINDAVKLQERWTGCERYPNTEALRVIVEVQVPEWLLDTDDSGSTRVALTDLRYIQFINLHVTAKYAPGNIAEKYLPGDMPFDGSIHEIINLEDSYL